MRAAPKQSDGPISTRLLTTAAALFREKGYAATTTRELASLLGIQNGSLYYHVGKKEDLLYALCVESLNRIHTAAAHATARQRIPQERLHALIKTHVTTSLADQDKHASMLFELRSLSDDRRNEVIKLRDAYEALVYKTVADAQAAGVLRSDLPTKYLVLGLLNLLNWTIFWFRPTGELTAAQLADLLTTLFETGAAGRAQ